MVHHHPQPRRPRLRRHFLVHHPQLHPNGLRPQPDRLIHRVTSYPWLSKNFITPWEARSGLTKAPTSAMRFVLVKISRIISSDMSLP